jgi:hypothetical protein
MMIGGTRVGPDGVRWGRVMALKIGYDRIEMECFAKVLVDGMG